MGLVGGGGGGSYVRFPSQVKSIKMQRRRLPPAAAALHGTIVGEAQSQIHGLSVSSALCSPKRCQSCICVSVCVTSSNWKLEPAMKLLNLTCWYLVLYTRNVSESKIHAGMCFTLELNATIAETCKAKKRIRKRKKGGINLG